MSNVVVADVGELLQAVTTPYVRHAGIRLHAIDSAAALVDRVVTFRPLLVLVPPGWLGAADRQALRDHVLPSHTRVWAACYSDRRVVYEPPTDYDDVVPVDTLDLELARLLLPTKDGWR